MRHLLWFAALCQLLVCLPSDAVGKGRMYGAQSFTGGLSTSLDGISYADGKGKCATLGGTCSGTVCSVAGTACYPLATGDGCIVDGGAGSGVYWYDAACIDPPNGLDNIHPIDNPGSGCWRLAKTTEAQISDLIHTVDTDTQLSDVDIATMGYIKTYTETDPSLVSHAANASAHHVKTVDTDTHLTETEVDVMVGNNGYSTGSHTIDTDTHLSDADIAVMGYLKSYTETDPVYMAWDKSAGINITEAQISDLTHTTDTDTKLTEAEVDVMTSNNGYSTGSHTIDTDTHLTDSDITTMGYIKTFNESDPGVIVHAVDANAHHVKTIDTDTHLTDSDITTMGYSKFDAANPGPIGATPSTGAFTTVQADAAAFTVATAQQLILGPQPVGTTGELSLPEDPANPGENTVGWKAPASIPATIKWILPAADGTAGQAFITDGTAHTGFADIPVLTDPGPIGAYSPNTIYATDIIADSIATNPSPQGTTETICVKEDTASAGGNKFCLAADTSITTDRTVLVPSQLPTYTTTCPTTATDACNKGEQCYDTSYLYICIADNSWLRAVLSPW